jgi:hypothetical protein
MNYKRQWKIGGSIYKILISKDFEFNGEKDGEIDVEKKTIKISKRSINSGSSVIIDTILHEVAHGSFKFLDISFENEDKEEHICEMIASVVKMLMIDNYENLKEILEELKSTKGKE